VAPGEAAKALAKLMHPHFVKEDEFALPPLGLLHPLAQGAVTAGMEGVPKLTDRLAARPAPRVALPDFLVAASLKRH
jgi:hypothetical protein